MVLISLEDLRKFYGPDPVLDGVTLELRAGEKVGLVGPNGVGKTTLLRVIAGQLDPDGGRRWQRPRLRISYLPQQPMFASDGTVWDAAREGLRDIVEMVQRSEALARRVAETRGSEQERAAYQYDLLQQQLLQVNGFQLDYRIEQVLQGLGFATASFHQPASQLSGGQQNRLLLAQCLLASADLLLLDEPSNHLDLPATQWVEDYLASSRQAFVIVSHDRYLLDRVTHHTLELFQGTVDRYRGNFSAYWKQKSLRLSVQQREYDKQHEEIRRMEDFVRRHHAGQKHVQAEDRRKKLQRIERVARPRRIESPPMRFPKPRRCGDIVLRVEQLAKTFQSRLFHGLTFQLQRGEKWGVFGRNGTGKTTLLRCILQQVPPDEGSVSWGTGIRVGYFDQQLAGVPVNQTAADSIRAGDPAPDEPARRHILAQFGITGEMAFQAVASLSGGERSRVALARLAVLRPNLLILDEPTNHLDLWARDALESALAEFDGSVLLVSHDRFFLNRVVDNLLVLDFEQHHVVHGNYEVYCQQQRQRDQSHGTGPKENRRVAQSAGSEGSRAKRPRRFPYRKVAEIEAEIAHREQAIEQLQLQLSDPEVVRDAQQIRAVQQRIAELQERVEQLYEHWEEALELN